MILGGHPTSLGGGSDGDLLNSRNFGAAAWKNLPPDQCLRLGMAVVDRVQTRLQGLPAHVLDAPLPDPTTALTFRLERRTANTLRRAISDGAAGPWTLKRYLKVPRFGGRAVVDLLAAAEANGGGANAREIVAERISDRALTIIARHLPISEKRVNEDLAACGAPTPFDLRDLVRSTVGRGQIALFHVLEIGGARIALRLSQLSAARTAYRVAARSIQSWGATTIASVASLLEAVPGSESTESFVEQVLVDLPAFRWIDRSNGWFWFVGHPNPLLDDLRKILSVTSRLPVPRLSRALFHIRRGGSPAPETLGRVCAEIPGARVAAGELIFNGRLDRSICLTETEIRLVTILEAAGGTLSLIDLRRAIQAMGLSWTPASHSVRTSPLFTTSGDALVHLL
ncbi:MAG TPA: hypothetical protein VH853_24300 [Polyangia bacterium]|nr:hypothetical protein [Polyangia bacterium]